jgi:hypothetical protein
MAGSITIYLFRTTMFARNGDTVVSVVPLDAVVSVYGGGGLFGEGGVSAAFGGAAFYRDDPRDKNSAAYVGVWGARKASRFRATFRRAGFEITIMRSAPPARLMFWQGGDKRAGSANFKDKAPG